MKERLEYIFLRYLKGTASESELEEFLSYAKKAKYDQALRDLIRGVYQDIRASDPGLVSYIDGSGQLLLTDPVWVPDDLPGAHPSDLSGTHLSNRPGTHAPDLPETSRPAGKRRRAAWAFALVILLVGLAMLFFRQKTVSHREVASTRSLTKKFTERAEYKFLLLPDSTQVWLNTNSSLEFPDEFSDKKREVFLVGEAYFDVRHAEELPFIIHTGKISTTVLGTAFNIKAYPYQQDVQVSVSKGKVRVSRDDMTVAILQKGQQVKVSQKDNDGTVRQKNIDTEQVSFWQKGGIAYEDETIGEIVQDLGQIYNVSILAKDPSLLNMKITTSFNRDIGIEQALRIICQLVDRRLEKEHGQYIIE